jgi:hypothetical protein
MTPTIADRMANEDPPMHHQNIVRIIDTLTVSGRAAILMEKAGAAPSPNVCGAMICPLSI